MREYFKFKIVKSGSLEYLREKQLEELRGQVQDFIEEGIVTYKANFVAITNGAETAGYACIGTHEHYKDIILEYYLVNKYRSYSGELLKQLAEYYRCKGWFVNSQDFFALPVMFDLGLAYEIHGYIFAVDCAEDASYEVENGISFKATKKEELQEVYRLIVQDDFYTGGGIETIEARLSVNELYSLRQDGRLIGVGFISVLKRTPGYADIAMIVEPTMRKKGWGTQILTALIHQCRLQDITPTACCDAKNMISRRTLQKAGFYLDGCTLLVNIE